MQHRRSITKSAKVNEASRPSLTRARSTGSIDPGLVEQQERERIMRDAGAFLLVGAESPEWLLNIFAATGIQSVLHRIENERIRRSDEFFVNPYPLFDAIVNTSCFEVLTGLVTLTNAAVVGVESMAGDDFADFFLQVELWFTITFIGEWTIRVLGCGWVWVFEWYNALDTFLVWIPLLISVVDLIEFFEVDKEAVSTFRVVRFVRVFRLVRLLRQPVFREAWLLIQGLVASKSSLIWIFILGSFIVYVFAIIATQTIGRNRDYADDPVAQELFGDLLKSMLSLFQVITLDKWCDQIASPLMYKNPGFIKAYFILFISLTVFVFWNLITAVIVDSALTLQKEDAQMLAAEADEEKKKELKTLYDIFIAIDADKSGEISRTEFTAALDTPQVLGVLGAIDMTTEELLQFWNLIADPYSDTLTIKEFAKGIRRMKGPARAKDVMDMSKRLVEVSRKEEVLSIEADKFAKVLQGIEHNTTQLAKDSDEIFALFCEINVRLRDHHIKIDKESRRDAARRKADEEAAVAEKDDGDAEVSDL